MKVTYKHIVSILALALAIPLVIATLRGFNISFNEFLIEFLYSLYFSSFLWLGSEFIMQILDKYLPWQHKYKKRIVVQVLLLCLLILTSVIFIGFFNGHWRNITHLKRSLVLPGIITFFINIQQLSRYFFFEWKKTLVQKEELEKEKIQQQYQSLKDQLNPHFLFNSLNTLSELVEEDKAKASEYIEKMADVYRYLLDHNSKATISLSKELVFLDSYIHLNKMKYGDLLLVNINIDERYKSQNIIPLSVQLLVENALKHNIIAQGKPLTIDLFVENECIVVGNNLRPKEVLNSSKTGLANVKYRYDLLGIEGFKIEKTETHFTVKLPLI